MHDIEERVESENTSETTTTSGRVNGKYCKILEAGEYLAGWVVIAEKNMRVAVDPKGSCHTCSGKGYMTMLIKGYRVRTECPCVVRRYRAWKEGLEDSKAEPMIPVRDGVLGEIEGPKALASPLDQDLHTQIGRLKTKLKGLENIETEARLEAGKAVGGQVSRIAEIQGEIVDIEVEMQCQYDTTDGLITKLDNTEGVYEQACKEVMADVDAEIDELMAQVTKLGAKIANAEAKRERNLAALAAKFTTQADGMYNGIGSAKSALKELATSKELLEARAQKLATEKDQVAKPILARVPVVEIRRTRGRLKLLQDRLAKRQAKRARGRGN